LPFFQQSFETEEMFGMGCVYHMTSSNAFQVVLALGLAGPMFHKSYYIKSEEAHVIHLRLYIHRETDSQRERERELKCFIIHRFEIVLCTTKTNGHN